MTDMNGATPSGAPVPPSHGDGAQQPPTPASSQPVSPAQPSPSYQAQPGPAHQAQTHYYQQPAGAAAHQKKAGGGRTFLTAFAGALLACVVAFGGLAIYNTASGSNQSNATMPQTQLGAQSSSSTSGSQDEDLTLPESVAK